jgi:hypothetical protein
MVHNEGLEGPFRGSSTSLLIHYFWIRPERRAGPVTQWPQDEDGLGMKVERSVGLSAAGRNAEQ